LLNLLDLGVVGLLQDEQLLAWRSPLVPSIHELSLHLLYVRLGESLGGLAHLVAALLLDGFQVHVFFLQELHLLLHVFLFDGELLVFIDQVHGFVLVEGELVILEVEEHLEVLGLTLDILQHVLQIRDLFTFFVFDLALFEGVHCGKGDGLAEVDGAHVSEALAGLLVLVGEAGLRPRPLMVAFLLGRGDLPPTHLLALP